MKIFLILCLIISNVAYSQSLTREELTGEWLCKNVLVSTEEELTPELKDATEKMRVGFAGARFSFRTNGIFNIQLPNASPELMGMLEFTDNKQWFVNDRRISIGTQRENIMHMDVTNVDGALSMAIFETPIILEMVKM